MMRRRFREIRRPLQGNSPPTDEIVENREFTQKAMSIVEKAMPKLSNGQQIIIKGILKGNSLGSVAREYQSDKAGEDDLNRVTSAYQNAITALRGYLTDFATANGVIMPRDLSL